jgi:HlyB family type I secretion system ABC transporter
MNRLADLLRSSPLLLALPEERITALAAGARLVQLPLGQALQRAGQLPSGAALLLEGRLRRLLAKPGAPPWNLGFVEPGEWLGWSALWRGEPELTLVASRPSTLLLLSAPVALAALEADASLRRALLVPSFEELAVLMAGEWERQGLFVEDRLGQLRQLQRDARVLGPDDALPSGHLLLFSGPHQPGGLQPGERLTAESSQWRQGAGGLPPRVLAIPEAALAAPLAGAATSSALTVTRPLGLVAPDNGAGDEELPASAAPGMATFTSRGADASRVEQALGCILHLAAARRLAVSEDLLRTSLADIEQRLEALRLPQVGLQLEALGFETRPLRARPWDLARLEPPAMIDLDGAFVLLLAGGARGGVLIGDPRHGLRRYGLAQLEKRYPEGLDVLVIRPERLDQQASSFGVGWFLPAFLRYPNLLALTLLSGFVGQLLATASPLGIMLLLNVVVGQQNTSLLLPLTLVLTVAAIASALLNGIRALLSADLSDRVDVRLGSAVVEHMLRLPLPYFERRQVGAILYNVNQLYSIRQFLVQQVLGVGLDLVFSVVFLVVLYIVSPTLTWITLLVVPVLIVLNLISTPLLQRLIKESNRHAASASSYLVEILSGMRTVKSQNFEVQARWEWLERYRRYTNSRFRLTELSSVLSETGNLARNLLNLAVFVVGAWLIVQNQLNVGALIAVNILAGNLVNPLLRLSSLWQGYQEMQLALACIGDVMLTLPEVGEEDRQALPLRVVKGELRFEAVSFRYGDRGPMLLDELDLLIPAGQLVGIVGLSGSGKSTLVQLIDRLYLPGDGHIYLDGYAIDKLQLASLRRRIGYVPQDSLLFEGTVLDNIRLNNPDADIEAVAAAARVADAHGFIMDLANGYATRLGERGSGLSGGQRQRICLARTVLQDPSLLILDEATSALDADTEQRVCRNLAKRFAGSTVLFITHRLTTLTGTDRILYMEKGHIIEDGNHAELIARRGSYAALWQQQMGKTDETTLAKNHA